MSGFDDFLQDPDREADYRREVAFFEENRVEISIGTLLCVLVFMQALRIVFWAILVALVLYAVLRRIPHLRPRLRYIWRVWFMPLAKVDDWIMDRWRDVKIWGAKERIRLAHDWELFKAWAALAVRPRKDEIAVAAMGQYKFGLVGRPLAPERFLLVAAFVAGVLMAGAIQSVRIHFIKGHLERVVGERNTAIQSARGWKAQAEQGLRDYAALREQRDSEIAKVTADNREAARLLEAERQRRAARTKRERAIDEQVRKAASGGPPPDWDSLVRERLGADPQGPAAPGSGDAPAPAGDPSVGMPSRP